MARGRAWAVAPDGTGLTCMFELTDPGPFAWGPRGDRVVVGGLAVRGVGSGASRPAVDLAPTYLSWGRPVGKAIVFADGPHLQKALIGSGQIDDITPFQEVTYRDVVYHPSGLAIAFVLDGAEGSSIWIASNTGTDAKRLVWSKSGTVFGSLAFDEGGDQLFYVAHQPTGKWFVSRLLLKEGTVEEGQWIGDRQVLKLELAAPIGLPEALTTVPPHGAALNVGTTCSDQQAVSSALDHSEGTPLLPGASAPTSAIGWLDPSRILVAEGGCDGPYDLWVTGPSGSSPVLLAEGVVQASVRVSAPAEPPPHPDLGINTEFA